MTTGKPPSDNKPPQNQGGDITQLIERRAFHEEERTTAIDLAAQRKAEREALSVAKIASKAQKKFRKDVLGYRSPMRWVWLTLAVIVAVGGTWGYKDPEGLKVRLGQAVSLVTELLFSPVPKIEGMSPNDLSALRKAASASLEKDGPKLAVAIVGSNGPSPTIYVSSNLPDSAVIDIYIHGAPGTVVGTPAFDKVVFVELTKHLAHTLPLANALGAPLPRGSYTIAATDAEKQTAAAQAVIDRISNRISPTGELAFLGSEKKILATVTAFLGGPQDGSYTEAIQKLHEDVRQKKQVLVGQLSPLVDNIDKGLSSMRAALAKIASSRAGEVRRKAWVKFRKEWLDFAGQVSKALEAKQNDKSPLPAKSVNYDNALTLAVALQKQLQFDVAQIKTCSDSEKNALMGRLDVHTKSLTGVKDLLSKIEKEFP